MCWKGKNTNYQDIYDFIDNNADDEKLKEFEAKLEEISLLDYNVYVCRFKKRMTYAETSKKLDDIGTNRVNDCVAGIALAFQMFIDIHV